MVQRVAARSLRLATSLGVLAAACNNGPGNLPPLLTGSGGEQDPECVVGISCAPAGGYCYAPTDAGCAFLYCDGSDLVWVCSPDGGFPSTTAEAGAGEDAAPTAQGPADAAQLPAEDASSDASPGAGADGPG